MTTIEDLKKEAREIGGASARGNGLKVQVSHQMPVLNYAEIFTWTVNDCAGNEDTARQCLADMNK